MWTGGKFTEVKIGDDVFTVRQFPPFYAIRVLGELQKIITPALGGVLKGISENNGDMDTENLGDMLQIISNGLEKLAYTIDGDKLELALKLLLDEKYVAVKIEKSNGKKDFIRLDEGAINEVFEGRIIDMIVLAIKIFKVNYLDFSQLSSVPIGVQKTLAEIKLPSFLAQQANTSEM
ncbi:MAG: phage tail assembly chaperone [Megamonas funiformis]|uniref:phage tail assembly chaperone n=1 Tax=Megamonas funiformis TaxID=437897 RepID=UPI003990A747